MSLALCGPLGYAIKNGDLDEVKTQCKTYAPSPKERVELMKFVMKTENNEKFAFDVVRILALNLPGFDPTITTGRDGQTAFGTAVAWCHWDIAHLLLHAQCINHDTALDNVADALSAIPRTPDTAKHIGSLQQEAAKAASGQCTLPEHQPESLVRTGKDTRRGERWSDFLQSILDGASIGGGFSAGGWLDNPNCAFAGDGATTYAAAGALPDGFRWTSAAIFDVHDASCLARTANSIFDASNAEIVKTMFPLSPSVLVDGLLIAGARYMVVQATTPGVHEAHAYLRRQGSPVCVR